MGINMCLSVGILILVILLSILIASVIYIFYDHKYKKAITELTRYNINVSAIIDDSIPIILESFVSQCFDDYRAIHLPVQIGYIDDDKINEIEREFTDIVVERLSPNMIDKVSLYYNHKAIADILSDKIYITVINFAIQNNSSNGFNESHRS